MGYTTDFWGSFSITPKLEEDMVEYLRKFSRTRRMGRRMDSRYGEEGEFFVEGKGVAGQDTDSTVINQNQPPAKQPGLWCQWVPTEDGEYLEWDGGEKFYNYVEWLTYMVDTFFEPLGYKLNGEVEWQGEDRNDRGIIQVENNEVVVLEAVTEYNEVNRHSAKARDTFVKNYLRRFKVAEDSIVQNLEV